MSKFLFIVLEGLDNSGKSTMCRLLGAALTPSTLVSFPSRNTPTGQILDSFLRGSSGRLNLELLHLLFSANRYEKDEFIRRSLKTGHVICDRYWYSGTAYSAAKGLDYDWCKQVDRHLPRPDLVIFMDVDETVVAARRGFGEEAHDKQWFQKKVYSVFQKLAAEEGFHRVDGSRTPGEILEDIMAQIERVQRSSQ